MINWELITIYYGRGAVSQDDYENGIVDDFVVISGKVRNEETMDMDIIFKLIKPFDKKECIINEAVIEQEQLNIIKQKLAKEDFLQYSIESVQKYKGQYSHTIDYLDTNTIMINTEHSAEPTLYSLKDFKEEFLTDKTKDINGY